MINVQRSPWGKLPPPMGGHTSTVWIRDGIKYLIVYGGSSVLDDFRIPKIFEEKKIVLNKTKNVFLPSIFLFNTKIMEWKEIIPKGNDMPLPRYCHSATGFREGKIDKILIYGGFSQNVALSDLWILHPRENLEDWEWKEIKKHEDPPPARYGHSIDLVRDKLIVFGGTNGIDYMDDLYLLEVEEDECFWRPINTSGPEPRAYHGSVYIEWEDHHCLVVFGGRTSATSCTNDIYVLCFNFVENSVFWMQPDTVGECPCPRYNHAMVAVDNKIYVIGGRTINENGVKETLNDMYVLNLDTLTWYKPSFTGLTNLPTRCWNTCNVVGSHFYLFGGYSDDETFGDVHILDTNAKYRNKNKNLLKFKGIQTSFAKLDQFGANPLGESMINMLGSTKSLKTIYEKNKTTQPNIMAQSLITCLTQGFLPVKDYNYEWDEPSHVWHKHQQEFLQLCIPLCQQVQKVMAEDPVLLSLSSPSYVLGDVHGNYKDLQFFSKSFWNFGLKLCPARSVLFLGDYVDRGPHSVETVMYLFALKLMHPTKVFLLRGNHEFRDVNGDTELYESTSFKAQCRALFGNNDMGDKVWEAVNNVFDYLPLAAVVDKRIFCVHGGVPRYTQGGSKNILHDIENIQRPLTEQHLLMDQTNQLPFTFDLMWADPAEPDEEEELDNDNSLFGTNERGGNTCIFSHRAMDEFFKKTGCSYIIRAHQRKDLGVDIQKGAKVLTVFSSSHYCGGHNSAAAILISEERIKVMIVKPFTISNVVEDDHLESFCSVGDLRNEDN
eukprot:TRINITY_DN4946_c0_g1_i1.p1 TRINITY_DN4946_c0_g1~~TRINITY_DN4946_c0_g1_i1.p1  ORF type:complete len:775 (-),score=194.86 TRINITY_DN4946_c0_g1_i1:41-2365(-)